MFYNLSFLKMNISVFIEKNSCGHVDCLQNIKGSHCYRNSPRAWPLKAFTSLKKKEKKSWISQDLKKEEQHRR